MIKWSFVFLLLIIVACKPSSSQKPTRLLNEFNVSLPGVSKEFSINLYNGEKQLKLSVPIIYVKSVEWKEMIQYDFYSEYTQGSNKIDLRGGRVEIVFNGKIINNLRIWSTTSAEFPRKGEYVYVERDGQVDLRSPIVTTYPTSDKEELYQYLKAKNKIKE